MRSLWPYSPSRPQTVTRDCRENRCRNLKLSGSEIWGQTPNSENHEFGVCPQISLIRSGVVSPAGSHIQLRYTGRRDGLDQKLAVFSVFARIGGFIPQHVLTLEFDRDLFANVGQVVDGRAIRV